MSKSLPPGILSAIDALRQELGHALFSTEEVAEHATKKSCYVIIDGMVFDVRLCVCTDVGI
jgi:cytochrome b involved in lipid metabolism